MIAREIAQTASDAPTTIVATGQACVGRAALTPGSDTRKVTPTTTAKTAPKTRFLALSVSDAAQDVIATIRAGARGYVTKTIGPDELVTAVRRVHEGDAVFSPRLAGFVLDAFAGDAPPNRSGGRSADRPRA